MGRWTRISLMAMAIFFGLAGRALATTYYIAANGNDSNNGTSKSTPWLHAPGMPNCSGTCASTTPQPGDQFIFRGGDTWHAGNPSATPYIGAGAANSCGTKKCGWVWKWSGRSGSPIYIGVDTTWYNSSVCGSQFCRPIINFDNPLSKSLVSSCSYDISSTTVPQFPAFGSVYGVLISYVTLDNFEFTGGCGTNGPGYLFQWGTNLIFENLYMHGWTEVSTGHDSQQLIQGNATGGVTLPTSDVIAYSVFDGSDSYCVATPTGYSTGQCMAVLSGGITSDFDHNVCRWMAGCLTANTIVTSHDNLFENLYESWDSTVHSDVEFNYGNVNPSASNMYFYNNVVRNCNAGQIVTLTRPSGAGAIYAFNNVFFGLNNRVALSFTANDTTNGTAYVTNNTFDQTQVAAQGPNGQPQVFHGTLYLQNNQWIGPNGVNVTTNQNPSVTVIDNGNEVIQSEAVANSQGYTASNNYQPSSDSGATYHAGANLSSSCSTYSADSELCSGSTGGVIDLTGSGTDPILEVSSPSLRGTSWDAGAYQYSGSTATQPSAPTSLVATVQ